MRTLEPYLPPSFHSINSSEKITQQFETIVYEPEVPQSKNTQNIGIFIFLPQRKHNKIICFVGQSKAQVSRAFLNGWVPQCLHSIGEVSPQSDWLPCFPGLWLSSSVMMWALHRWLELTTSTFHWESLLTANRMVLRKIFCLVCMLLSIEQSSVV